jgi:hypothetical protein
MMTLWYWGIPFAWVGFIFMLRHFDPMEARERDGFDGVVVLLYVVMAGVASWFWPISLAGILAWLFAGWVEDRLHRYDKERKV